MPFIFIGTGGMGKETISRIKYLTESAKIKNVFFLGFDIDSAISPDKTADITQPNICVERPFDEIKALEEAKNQEFLKWWPKGHTIRTTLCGSTGAGQIRINGRYALFSRYGVIYHHIENIINDANDIAKTDPNDKVIRVFLVSSLGGGTGAGIFLDISFLVRHLLGNQHRFYGVFYDGTITKPYGPNTLGFSYAALSEIEYWLQNFSSFEMQYGQGERLSGRNEVKLFDIVFLLQAETSDGKVFKRVDKKVCPYIPMAAEALFSLVSIPDFMQFAEANSWNRFDQIHNSGMQINYASFGIGAIAYDQDEVRNYIVHQLIKKYILLKDVKAFVSADEADLASAGGASFTEEIEKPFMISERIDQSLTGRVLHGSKQFGPIMDRVEGLKKKISGSTKIDELQQLKSQYKIPIKTTDNFDEWQLLLTNYEADLKKILFDKRIQLTQKLEETVSNRVIRSGIEMAELTGWLDEALGVIEKNEEYILKHKNYPQRSVSIDNLGKTWANLLKDKKILGGLKIEYKVRLAAAVDGWIQSELGSVEMPAMKDFYAQLKKKVSGWKTVINILQEHIESVRRKIDIELGKYTSRDVAYNQDSLASNEFPLFIKLDINKELIDKHVLDEMILQDREKSEQLSKIGEIVYSGKGELLGIEHYFAMIAKEVFEGRERQVRTEAKIEDGLYKLFFDIVEEKVRPVLNEIHIDDILEYWLRRQLYPVAKRYYADNNTKALLELGKSWAINFGEAASDLLISPQFYGGTAQEEKWFRAALKSFIQNFEGKIRPFISYGSQTRMNYWDKIILDTDSKNAFADHLTVFVPTGFKFTDILSERGERNILQIRSGFNKIKFFAETYAFPLHALDLVKGYQEYRVREEYLEHRDSVSKAIGQGSVPSLLRHIDKRFYTDWLIDIGASEMADIQGYWLYVLGLGLGFVSRDDKGKYLLTIGGTKTTIDKTLNGTVERIRKDAHLRESLKTSALNEIKSRYFSSGKDFASVEELFRKAHSIHFDVRPPRGTRATEAAYALWSEIEGWIKPLEDGSFPASSRVPRNWEEMERLMATL
jgi:hypothetical protein